MVIVVLVCVLAVDIAGFFVSIHQYKYGNHCIYYTNYKINIHPVLFLFVGSLTQIIMAIIVIIIGSIHFIIDKYCTRNRKHDKLLMKIRMFGFGLMITGQLFITSWAVLGLQLKYNKRYTCIAVDNLILMWCIFKLVLECCVLFGLKHSY